ncbi:IQ domain-containing protein E isoform X13 [Heliangelus exortis]|uniref:IQ domain-containing protein E isoform X13 n=1 Tax=Heliangelus exortis TaxID=472823 RepID=UPI003A8FB74D
MARDAGEAAAEGELGDDSLSVISCESDTEMKLKKKIFHKPPKSPKSPYSSSTQLYPKKASVWRALQGTGSARLESAAGKNPRQMWLGSLKQGMSHPLKSDVDVGHMQTNIFSSTPEYLKEALGMKKPKHSRSSSNGYIPGTPDYKEKEDMYDEIIELKKTIQAQKNEGHRMKTKLRRLEEENNRKDKQIEQLLDPSRGSELARALSEKKTDNGWVVSGLKQKIFKLEQECKEKDNTINKFQADMKTTDLEDMRLAMETYYEEVHRLQLLLAKSETMRKNTEGRDTQKRLKALSAAVLRLSRNIKELQNENQRLKEDLDQVLRSSSSNKRKNYSEWSRQRLVRRILELEKKVCAMENTRVSPEDSEPSQLLAVSSSPSIDPDHPASHQTDHLEECHHLQRLVKKLNSDRKALQNLLLNKDEDIQNLTQKVGKLESKLEEEKRQIAEDTMEKLNKSSSVCMVKGKEDHRKEQAAKIIQRQWRIYQNKISCMSPVSNSLSLSSDCKEKDEIVTFIQSIFRAHLARTVPLEERPSVSSAPSEKADSAVYITEKKPVPAALQRPSSTFTSSPPARSSEKQSQPPLPQSVDEAHSDDSDDIVIVSPLLQMKKNYTHF